VKKERNVAIVEVVADKIRFKLLTSLLTKEEKQIREVEEKLLKRGIILSPEVHQILRILSYEKERENSCFSKNVLYPEEMYYLYLLKSSTKKEFYLAMEVYEEEVCHE
jgi:hypothetical protein